MLLCDGDPVLFALFAFGIIGLLLGGCLWGQGESESNSSERTSGIIILSLGSVSISLSAVIFYRRKIIEKCKDVDDDEETDDPYSNSHQTNLLKSRELGLSESEADMKEKMAYIGSHSWGRMRDTTPSYHHNVIQNRIQTKISNYHYEPSAYFKESHSRDIYKTERQSSREETDVKLTQAYRASVRKFNQHRQQQLPVANNSVHGFHHPTIATRTHGSSQQYYLK